jgi:tetratricopeptide (TPR) repeat protein
MYAIAALLAVTVAGADPFDKAELRRIIRLPTADVSFNWRFLDGQLVVPDANAFLPDEIAATDKAVQSDPSNPDLCHKLADLYEQAGDQAKADAADKRAVELYRARLARNPKDGLCRARRAQAQHWQANWERIDTELREAAASSPGEWECWMIRSRFLRLRAVTTLVGESESRRFGLMEVAIRVRDGRLRQDTLKEAETLYREALQCLDRATAIAPTRLEPVADRLGCDGAEAAILWAKQSLEGERVDPALLQRLALRHTPDLWRAAALAPDSSPLVGGAAFMELAHAQKYLNGPPAGLETMTSLTPESRKAIRDTIARLRRIAASADLQTKTNAAETLACISDASGEPAGAEEFLAEVVRRKPSLEGAWNLWTCLVVKKPNHQAELLALCRERFNSKDCAWNRFLLARAYDEAGRVAEARKVLEEALQREPDDVECNFSLAAELMRTGNAADLDRAGKLLKHGAGVGGNDRSEMRRARFLNYGILWCTYLALSDQFDELRVVATNLKDHALFDQRLIEFERIVGPEQMLAPPPGPVIRPVSGTSR